MYHGGGGEVKLLKKNGMLQAKLAGRVQWLWENIFPTRLKECLNTKEVA
jgi:hypothetical protein